MTRVINFDKAFKFTVPLSLVVIIWRASSPSASMGFNNGRRFPGGPQFQHRVRAALDEA